MDARPLRQASHVATGGLDKVHQGQTVSIVGKHGLVETRQEWDRGKGRRSLTGGVDKLQHVEVTNEQHSHGRHGCQDLRSGGRGGAASTVEMEATAGTSSHVRGLRRPRTLRGRRCRNPHTRPTGSPGYGEKFDADTCHRGARSQCHRAGVHALIGPLPRKGALRPRALRLVHRARRRRRRLQTVVRSASR